MRRAFSMTLQSMFYQEAGMHLQLARCTCSHTLSVHSFRAVRPGHDSVVARYGRFSLVSLVAIDEHTYMSRSHADPALSKGCLGLRRCADWPAEWIPGFVVIPLEELLPARQAAASWCLLAAARRCPPSLRLGQAILCEVFCSPVVEPRIKPHGVNKLLTACCLDR